jgi:hypothetical protein
MEKIVMSAVRLSESIIVSTPKPGRHYDVIKHLSTIGYDCRGVESGFITSEGRFVDRKEGRDIAVGAGQCSSCDVGGELTTQDLW